MVRIRFSVRGKLCCDCALALAGILCFGMRFTGEAAHEALGFAALLLVAVHLYAGRAWFGRIRCGKYTARRRLTSLANALLFTATVVVFGSGLALFFALGEGLAVRQLHTAGAYWTLVLTGVHLGLYWYRVAVFLHPANGLRGGLFRAALLVFALYGIWASCERQLGEKLLLGASFDFWPPDRPMIVYWLNHLAVAVLYAAAARSLLALAGLQERKERP